MSKAKATNGAGSKEVRLSTQDEENVVEIDAGIWIKTCFTDARLDESKRASESESAAFVAGPSVTVERKAGIYQKVVRPVDGESLIRFVVVVTVPLSSDSVTLSKSAFDGVAVEARDRKSVV